MVTPSATTLLLWLAVSQAGDVPLPTLSPNATLRDVLVWFVGLILAGDRVWFHIARRKGGVLSAERIEDQIKALADALRGMAATLQATLSRVEEADRHLTEHANEERREHVQIVTTLTSISHQMERTAESQRRTVEVIDRTMDHLMAQGRDLAAIRTATDEIKAFSLVR